MYEIKREEVVGLLKELVGIASPYFEEEEIMSFTKKWFDKNGMDVFTHSYHEKKVTNFKGKNIVVELKGSEEGPTVCLNGHLDSVMLCSGWTRKPYGEEDGDKFYGVGALDMKGGCAATMVALKAFGKNHQKFRGKILSTYVSVEEGPYGMGTNALIEDEIISNVDISLITEPSAGFSENAFPDLCLGARGGYGLDVEFFGVSAHAATPEKGVSAAEDAAKFICALENIKFIEDLHLGKGSVCVVSVECDGGACSVPDYAKVKLFWHIVVGESQETIREQIDDVAEKANLKGEFKVSFRKAPSKESEGFRPYTVSAEDEFAKKFINAIETVCNETPSISYFKSIGDFNYLGSRLGSPALIFGPAGENFHSKDEYVSIESVVNTAKVIYQFLENILVT